MATVQKTKQAQVGLTFFRLASTLCLFVFCGMCFLCIWSRDIPAALAIRTIPIPPNATPRYLARDGIKFNSEFHFASRERYDINVPLPAMVAYYKSELGKQGWTLAKEETIYRNWICLVLKKGAVFRVTVDMLGYPSDSEQTDRVVIDVDTSSVPLPIRDCK